MKPWVVVCGLVSSVTVFGLVFCLNPDTPRYFPVERAWHISEPGVGPAMGWYGRSGAALLAGGLAAAIGLAGARWRLRRDECAKLKSLWVMALTVIVLIALVVVSASVVTEQWQWFEEPPTNATSNPEY